MKVVRMWELPRPAVEKKMKMFDQPETQSPTVRKFALDEVYEKENF